MNEEVKWETDFDHAGSFSVPEATTIAEKLRLAWGDHNSKYPTCTLCDIMTVDEDFI